MSMSVVRISVLFSFILAGLAGTSFAQYDAGRAGISLSVNNGVYPYRVLGT